MAKGKKKDKDKKKNKAKDKVAKHAVEHGSKKKDDAKAVKAAESKPASVVACKPALAPEPTPVSEPTPVPEPSAQVAAKAPSEFEGKHAIRKDYVAFTMPGEETLYGLANLFKIFADATRLRILFALVEGPKCVADISEAAGVTQGATSHQLRSMKQERIVDFVRDGKQVIYSLADERVQSLLAQGLSYIDE